MAQTGSEQGYQQTVLDLLWWTEKFHEASALQKEVEATKECWKK